MPLVRFCMRNLRVAASRKSERTEEAATERETLTLELDEGELVDGASHRFVVEGEIEQRQSSNFLHPLGAAPRASGGRSPHRQHPANLEEGGAVGFLQGLDAEGEEGRGRLQVSRAPRHLVPQRAHPRFPRLSGGFDQPRFPRLQKAHQGCHPILHFLLQRDALFLLNEHESDSVRRAKPSWIAALTRAQRVKLPRNSNDIYEPRRGFP